MYSNSPGNQAGVAPKLDTLGMAETMPFAPSREALRAREEFIEKHQIKLFPQSATQVEYVLPAGLARIDFILEAQKIAQALDPARKVAQNSQIELWSKDPSFCKPLSVERAFAVDCMVAETGEKTRTEQRLFLATKGLVMAGIHDLAAAHVSYLIASDWRDPFREGHLSCTVRGAGGQLIYSPGGLTERCFFMHDSQAHPALRAGAYIKVGQPRLTLAA